MDTREMLEKNTVCGPRGRKKLLYCKSIACICLFMLMLIVIASCGGSYYSSYEDYQGHYVISSAAEHYNQGVEYDRQGDYARAISEYTMALEIDPNAAMYNNRGNSYKAMGQYDQAFADWTTAIELDPNHSFAYCNRGGAYSEKGQYVKAMADLNKAIALDPKYARAYYLKAGVCANMKRNKEAIEAYRAFLTYASPQDTRIEYAKERIAELEKQR